MWLLNASLQACHAWGTHGHTSKYGGDTRVDSDVTNMVWPALDIAIREIADASLFLCFFFFFIFFEKTNETLRIITNEAV
ncbi:MAG TPA: hypothetical protein VGO47_02105 [Chlamydiales bacterium]|nr:hypothetical protein [Chlamydiales bacterium]